MAEKENNSVDLSNLSMKQIEEIYDDIVSFSNDDVFITRICKGATYCDGF